MQGSATDRTARNSVVVHPLDPMDAPISAAMRSMLRAVKGAATGAETRGQYDAFMKGVMPPDDVKYEAGTCRHVPGLWVYPANWRSDETILHLHGGWFNFGSAAAYGHLVGHIAVRAGARAFIPDYRLAPENPFPAATDDVLACYQGLLENGIRRIALTGDSAGGNLALGLASRITNDTDKSLVGTAVFSPVTDLTLSGDTYSTRAEEDPIFTRAQVAALVHSYLGNADPKQPLASPLQGKFAGMAPIRVHVGDDEVLLDDSRRYIDHAISAGVDAKLDLWMGMAHGFIANVDKLKAAGQALDTVGAFLAGRLRDRP